MLGQFPEAPDALLASIEADLYPRHAPDKSDLIDGAIGELSAFHQTFGYYAHGVDDTTATLPAGWADRLVPIANENTGGATGWCLEVHDLAVSKLVAGRERDLDFVRVLVRERMLDPLLVRQRVTMLTASEDVKQAVGARLLRVEAMTPSMPVEFDLFDSAYNDVLTASSYAVFCNRLTSYDCQKCPRGKARNHIVLDRGNPDSKILIVSERPGDNEDVMAKAFVGRSGELLDKIMGSIGLDTNRDLLIVNVVKCKAEIDRAPTTPEIEACFPYLRRQIELMKPKVIVLLGAVALKYLVKGRGDEFSMEKEAGNLFTAPEYPNIHFMVLYHPAFLLRDPTKKAVMWEHVKKLRAFLNEHGWLPTN